MGLQPAASDMLGQVLRVKNEQLLQRPAAEGLHVDVQLEGQLEGLRRGRGKLPLLDAPQIVDADVATGGQLGAAQVEVTAAGGQGGADRRGIGGSFHRDEYIRI